VGPYRLQAAIAAVHDEATCAAETDWPRILALYDLLAHISPNPVVRLNRAVAVAMVRGAKAGLSLLDGLSDGLSGNHRLHAVRAHLLEKQGNLASARENYRRAAEMTLSLPERYYLLKNAAGLHIE